jgi:hypothetical protein
MTPEQKAAYVIPQSATTLVEAMGMISDNKIREDQGHALAYDGAAFQELINRSGIHHNAVVELFRE